MLSFAPIKICYVDLKILNNGAFLFTFAAWYLRRSELNTESSNCTITKCTNLPEVSFIAPAFQPPVSFY